MSNGSTTDDAGGVGTRGVWSARPGAVQRATEAAEGPYSNGTAQGDGRRWDTLLPWREDVAEVLQGFIPTRPQPGCWVLDVDAAIAAFHDRGPDIHEHEQQD